MERQRGMWALGTAVDGGEPVTYESADLVTHGVVVGMTGSGKTGLGVVLVEEALLDGVGVLVLDPKGDMGNLALRFPDLAPADFLPWVDPGEAARAGVAPDALAASTAAAWRDGLAGSGLSGADVARLRDAADVTVYTPGSTAGVPIDVLGSLRPPPGLTWERDAEQLREAVADSVLGLCALAGVDADPVSPQVSLLATVAETAWRAGRDLDLAGLIGQVLEPPFRTLGVFEVDVVLPPGERRALALRLNALVASPSFAPWMSGVPLDVGALLFDGDQPRCAVVYLAHLSEAERQFAVTLILSRVVTWMRAQPGTSALRALVYMDEVAGYAPPTAVPPSKRPILTILKQARAYGVGMVLSTQNPVDLDYKALSNAGTWWIGRLQTERDKARLVDGLRGAGGDADAADAAISGLGKRQFLLHRTGGDPAVVLATRWAMSYLRGPITREELERLPGTGVESGVGVVAPPAAVAEPPPDGATVVRPTLAERGREAWLDPAAPWAAKVGAVPGGTSWSPALVARVHLRFDDARADVRHTEEWEAVWHPLPAEPDPADALRVDVDDRDLGGAAPDGGTYALPDAPVDRATWWTAATAAVKRGLTRTEVLTLPRNAALKLVGRVDEPPEEFAARCRAEAARRAEAEAADVTRRFAVRVAREQRQAATAGVRVQQAEADAATRRNQEMVAGAGDVLGVLFGGGSRSRRAFGAAGGIASRRGTTSRAGDRLATLRAKLDQEESDLAEVTEELQETLAALRDEWEDAAAQIDELELDLAAADVDVDALTLVWVPVA